MQELLRPWFVEARKLESLSKKGPYHRRLNPYRNLGRDDWPSSNQARCIEYPSYSYILYMRIRQLNGSGSTQALLTRLRDHSNYRYHFYIDSDESFANSLSQTLTFGQVSLKILRSNYEVMLVHCTYKTSHAALELNIIGVTAIDSSSSAESCFLKFRCWEWREILERYRDLYDELGRLITSARDSVFLEALDRDSIPAVKLLPLYPVSLQEYPCLLQNGIQRSGREKSESFGRDIRTKVTRNLGRTTAQYQVGILC